jgi:hypothetical protein
MKKRKLDNLLLGVAGGLFLPFLSVMIYWLWSFKYMNFIPQFFQFLLTGRVLAAVLSLCLIPNLGLFFLFLNKENYKTAKGIILTLFIYGAIILFLKIKVEHTWGD